MLKKNKLFLIGIVIGFIIIGGIVIYPIIIELNKPEPIYYIATDDTYYSGHDNQEISHGNNTSLIAGRYETNTGSSIYYTFIKFDLTNKPKVWNTLEVSFYVYEYLREQDVFMNVMVLSFDWNEIMSSWDVYRNKPYITADFKFKFIIGLYKINITEYIEDNENITVGIFGYGGYSSSGYFDNHIKIYSKEANTTIDKLPQLIWS